MESTSTRRRRLDKDVSMDEMRRLREQGMSNKDIAESLEISYATVLKYIGKQGRRMERIAAFADQHLPTQPHAKPRAELAQTGVIYALDEYTAVLDYAGGRATLTADGSSLTIPLANLPAFAQFAVSIAYRGGDSIAQ